MAIMTYKRGDKTPLTENFLRKEFDCKCGKCNTKHDPELSHKLQIMREHFGKSIIITSGYRCLVHNANVGGASKSYHTLGMAADIIVVDVNTSEVCKFAESIGFYGIGIYDDGYVHVDTRPKECKAFWRNHEQIPIETFGAVEAPEVSAKQLASEIREVLKKYGY